MGDHSFYTGDQAHYVSPQPQPDSGDAGAEEFAASPGGIAKKIWQGSGAAGSGADEALQRSRGQPLEWLSASGDSDADFVWSLRSVGGGRSDVAKSWIFLDSGSQFPQFFVGDGLGA